MTTKTRKVSDGSAKANPQDWYMRKSVDILEIRTIVKPQTIHSFEVIHSSNRRAHETQLFVSTESRKIRHIPAINECENGDTSERSNVKKITLCQKHILKHT